MSLKEFESIDNETIDNSTIKRDFLKIYLRTSSKFE